MISSIDCRDCGACCRSLLKTGDAYVTLWPDDRRRLPAHWIVLDGRRHALAAEAGRCVALEGTLGERVRCTIYPDRPSICRSVEVGDEVCGRARAAAGLPPLPPRPPRSD